MQDHLITQQARDWLQQRGVVPVSLQRMSGHTNHVFLVEQAAGTRTILRLANHCLDTGLCPLAHQAARLIAIHQDAVALGLAPELLGYDTQQGLMWLRYAGQPAVLQEGDCATLRVLLDGLHRSQLNWFDGAEQDSDGAGLSYLQQMLSRPPDGGGLLPEFVQRYAARLYESGVQRGYADYPLVPVHSDLNPGNCLYDETSGRWSLIDWDFAGMRVAEWDYAGLIVEHGWTLEQGRAFVPRRISTADLNWFCAVFALLSWDWHMQRGSPVAVLKEKQANFDYWMSMAAVTLNPEY